MAAHTHGRIYPDYSSVISLLSSNRPDLDSPANVDAAKEVRENWPSYKKKVRRLVRKSADKMD